VGNPAVPRRTLFYQDLENGCVPTPEEVKGTRSVRIFGETKPCTRMDQAFPGLKDAMWAQWNGGAIGEALDDGPITVGDAVEWIT